MIRNLHDILRGYEFSLSQAHRSREKRCAFFVNETEQCSLLGCRISYTDMFDKFHSICKH